MSAAIKEMPSLDMPVLWRDTFQTTYHVATSPAEAFNGKEAEGQRWYMGLVANYPTLTNKRDELTVGTVEAFLHKAAAEKVVTPSVAAALRDFASTGTCADSCCT